MPSRKVQFTQPMTTSFDRTKTVEQLENADWGEPTYSSHLVTTIHRLRRKPLNEFTVEDLRIMIGQNVGLVYLIPMAIERLNEDPLISGDYYQGDLLKQVLTVELKFWQENAELYRAVNALITKVEILRDTIENQLLPAAEVFRSSEPN